MPFQSTPKHLVTICTVFHFALGKGGRGKGGGDIGDATSGLSLAPLPATAFAFYVISAIFTAFQALQEITNIHRRLSKRPPSIALPEYAVGPIFPISVLLSALVFFISDVLSAISVGVQNNQNTSPLAHRTTLSQSFFIAIRVMGSLTDIPLILSAFALLAHREKVLTTTSPVIRGTKITFDAVLTAGLLSVRMAIIGLKTSSLRALGTEAGNNLYSAFLALLLAAAVDILVSSIILHVRARSSPVNDHRITYNIALITAPAFILYAIFSIILWNINIPSAVARQQVGVASAVVLSILRFIIIGSYLGFGMPPLPKQREGKS